VDRPTGRQAGNAPPGFRAPLRCATGVRKVTSFPPNFIPIVDAFGQAFDKLAPVDMVRWAEAPIEADFVEFDQAKLDEFDEAKRKVERLFRDALADGLIKAWVKEGGRMEVLIDRESWRPMSLGAPGFEPRTHHLVNPGPNDERPVAVEREHFEVWLRTTAGQGMSDRWLCSKRREPARVTR
jgi:hypothetical protein